jgi:flagellar basal-body rod protein FlgB
MPYSLKVDGLAQTVGGALTSEKLVAEVTSSVSQSLTFRALLDQSLQRTTFNGLRTNGKHMPLPESGGVDAGFDLRALNVLAQRQQLIASNIANADTPNYKAKDVDWRSAIQEANQYRPPSLEMTVSVSAHFVARRSEVVSELKHKYRVPTQGAIDGNTVEMDVERAQFAENALRYKFSLQMVGEEVSEMGQLLKSIAR